MCHDNYVRLVWMLTKKPVFDLEIRSLVGMVLCFVWVMAVGAGVGILSGLLFCIMFEIVRYLVLFFVSGEAVTG